MVDAVLFRVYNPKKHIVNSVMGITQQLAVPRELRKHVM